MKRNLLIRPLVLFLAVISFITIIGATSSNVVNAKNNEETISYDKLTKEEASEYLSLILNNANNVSEEAGNIMQEIIQAIFADDDGVVGVKQVFKTIFSTIGYVNAGANFLKLVGIMKDGTGEALANIQEQLNMISDKLIAMDAKLDAIINEMAALKGETRFISRTETARDYRRYFNDFIRDYCTKGLNPLITDFESMRIDSMKKWYNSQSADAREGELLDNSTIILVWDYEENEDPSYVLRYHKENDLPSDCTESGFNGRYLILTSDILPTKKDVAQWHVDTYHEVLSNYIYDQINAHENDLEKSGFNNQMSDTEKKTIASDAVNLLVYRTTAEAVNESSSFANTVLDKFNDYILYLLKDENGFDAAVKALYYTHTFEGEVSDTIANLYQSLVFEVGYYGAFVKDVINMSNDISKDKIKTFDDAYSNTIVKLLKAKDKSITGYSNYCYITNTILYYGTTTMSAQGKIRSHSPLGGGAGGGYDGYSVTDFSTENIVKAKDGSIKKYNNSALIGTDAATLISLTLRSNGITADHEYLVQTLGNGQTLDNYNVIIVANEGISDIPFDSTTPLFTNLVIGNYFPADKTITLEAYQHKYDKDYFVYRHQIKGSLFDFTTTSQKSSVVLAAFAMYGESHWWWSMDEACFMSGSPYGKVERSSIRNSPTKRDHVDNYSVTFKYNSILQEAVPSKFELDDGTLNPLSSYKEQNHYVDIDTKQIDTSDIKTYGEEDTFNSKAGYYCMIIIPSAIVGSAVIFCGIFFGIRVYRKKKNATK